MKTSFQTNQAIVVGRPHHNTLGLIRSLGIKGIFPIVFLISPSKHNGCIISKYIKEIEYFDDAKQVVQRLLEEVPYLESKAILFAANDAACCEIDANYEKLKNHYCFFNAQGRLRHLMNKEVMCQMAEQTGLTTPKRILYGKGDNIPINVPYPCITKAISSLDGKKPDNITICHNEDQLLKSLSRPNICNVVQIEEFINKEFEFQFIGLSLNEGEQIIIPGHSHIIRPKGIDNTYFFHYIPNGKEFDCTVKAAENFIRNAKFSGLFSMEFIQGKDGQNYFLEMNFRNDGNAICVTDAGFNLPYIWWSYCSNRDYQKEIDESVFRKVLFCPEYNCMHYCVEGEMSVFKYCSVFIKSNSKSNYYRKDKQGYWSRFCREFVKKIILAKIFKIKYFI